MGSISWEVLEQLHRVEAVEDEALITQEGGREWNSFTELKVHREMQALLALVLGSETAPASPQSEIPVSVTLHSSRSLEISNEFSQYAEAV